VSNTSETLTTPDLLDRLSALLPGMSRRELERFLKFSVVGTIGAVVDFGTFNLLNALGWLSPIELALPLGITLTGVGIASMISFGLAVTSNFIWNRYWTYPDSRSKPLLAQYFTFLGINIAGLAIRVPLLEGLRGPISRLLAEQFGLQVKKADFLGDNLALAIAVVVVLFWNFFVNRYITYSDVEKD
jgi:putative flippase GtrA